MSFDTKYRPRTYDDVVGQQATIRILREVVKAGRGFQQSYIFAGPHGSGKTTLGRILAQSLLCSNPSEGQACGSCTSCQAFLEGSNPDFIEVDAATNSGKDDMKAIVDQLQYSTFSGNRRLYLFDESHQLSKNALDAILKPLEDTLPGSDDKKLVCIFCTTEPERMRQTIRSRCAPVFTIRKPPVDDIVDRLRYIADQEGLTAEDEAMRLIVEISESHMRDALKALEGVASLGDIDRSNVSTYLHLDANDQILSLLSSIGSDETRAVQIASGLIERMPPSILYEKLSETAMLAYRVGLGAAKPPSYWNADTVNALSEQHGKFLIQIADRLASRPRKPSFPMLLCDLTFLHHGRLGGMAPIRTEVPVLPTAVSVLSSITQQPETSTHTASTESEETASPATEPADEDSSLTQYHVESDSVAFMPQIAQKKHMRGNVEDEGSVPHAGPITKALFMDAVKEQTTRLQKQLGQSGSKNMGGG